MNTFEEIKRLVVTKTLKGIKKVDLIKVADNIAWLISPKTGKRITLNTYLSYSIPYKVCHGYRDLNKLELYNLLSNATNHNQFAYKNILGFFTN